jgi:hypothetical protein
VFLSTAHRRGGLANQMQLAPVMTCPKSGRDTICHDVTDDPLTRVRRRRMSGFVRVCHRCVLGEVIWCRRVESHSYKIFVSGVKGTQTLDVHSTTLVEDLQNEIRTKNGFVGDERSPHIEGAVER